MLSPVEDGPRNAAGVLALKEQTLRLAVLEAEDLAVTTDVELALQLPKNVSHGLRRASQAPSSAWARRGIVERVERRSRGGYAPCQGRSSDR